MKNLFRKLRFLLVFVVLLVGCQQEENNVEQNLLLKTEEKVQITKEEERSIQDVIHTFVRTTNEKSCRTYGVIFKEDA